MDRRLVDHLVNSSLVSRAAMQRMILRATKDKTGVVEQLLRDDKVDEEAVARELADYYELGTVDTQDFSVSDTALKFISKSMANKHGVLPYAVSDSADHVTVAVFNPEAAQSVVDSLKTATGKVPKVEVAPRTWLEHAIRHFYFGEEWAAAPAHRAATREVAAVVQELGLGGESSSEIVLDEVVVPPAPKPKKNRTASKAAAEPEPEPEPDPVSDVIVIDEPPPPKQRRRKRSEPSAEKARRSSRAGADSEAEVEAALDEFDAFLDSATGWGTVGNRSGIPGWDEDNKSIAKDDNPFARDDDEWEESAAPGGFSLFDEKSEGDAMGLSELVEEHERTIDRLSREIQQQRDIISALVDALVDAGVVSKRDIRHRVKRK